MPWLQNHGWSDKTFQTGDDGAIIQASVKKDVGGGVTGGMVNPGGARNYAHLLFLTSKKLKIIK